MKRYDLTDLGDHLEQQIVAHYHCMRQARRGRDAATNPFDRMSLAHQASLHEHALWSLRGLRKQAIRQARRQAEATR